MTNLNRSSTIASEAAIILGEKEKKKNANNSNERILNDFYVMFAVKNYSYMLLTFHVPKIYSKMFESHSM